MKTEQPKLDWSELLELASDPQTTPFDYVIVGSGAGGGPLAARLALNHQRVLVLEAGSDPAVHPDPKAPPQPLGGTADDRMREVYAVPAYHAAATEDPYISWDFSVRHYDDDKRQARDSKYDPQRDPSTNQGEGKGGIQYPRAAAVGGCTSHHAMIIIRPNDRDWDGIAELTNDSSWRSENMQGYFAKIENCLYYAVYKRFFGKLLGWFLFAIQWVARQLNPRRHLDPGGHGSAGWQTTSFIDPLVITGIALGDRTFLRVLRDVLFSALANKDERSLIKRALSNLQVIQFLDPNVRSPDIPTRAHLSLISIGTDGKKRCGLREHLLKVATKHPENLVLATDVHATRLLFAEADGAAPRAIGVEASLGSHLYRASPLAGGQDKDKAKTKQYFARREVIVCGGAFNTPQLLMLSGIGDAAHLQAKGIAGLRGPDGKLIAPVVDLPGVGANLQDRYEISVISEAKDDFSTLKGISFIPEDKQDPARIRWLKEGTGLYSTNGGALAMMLSSKPNTALRDEPDLFVFGFPAAFRGYYWGWSRQLLRRVKDAQADVRNLWSWVILKAYTRNNRGTVRLRSADPFDVPDINFRSFSEAGPEHQQDLRSLTEAVEIVRRMNRSISVFTGEIQPGAALPDHSKGLAEWVQDEAWGHHACGTCRIGPDAWKSDVTALTDRNAVIDSKFRVHGVSGLRIVDASVFPEIPGYFIVTPIFMIAEKAADTLLEDSEKYPNELERIEADAVCRRRRVAYPEKAPEPVLTKLPEDTVGLALSGGGIRSATYCLGILQAMAKRGLLRRIDIQSTVSGGGYAGAFLGKLYSRIAERVKDKAGRVSDIIADGTSPEIWWLRRNANYIGAAGRSDLHTNLAIFARNLATVHLFVGALLFGLFGLMHWIASLVTGPRPMALGGVELSFWWWLPLVVLLAGVLPLAMGYWLAPSADPRRAYPPLALLLWLGLLASAVYALGLPGAGTWAGVAIGVLLLAWLSQEVSRWGFARRAARAEAGDAGTIPLSTLVRNRLTRALGAAILALAAALAWVVLDSASQLVARRGMMAIVAGVMVVLAPFLPLLRRVITGLVVGTPANPVVPAAGWKREFVMRGMAFLLGGLLLFFLDVLAHSIFVKNPVVGAWAVATALIGSAIIGRAFPFLNLSSLQQSYSQKLVRTFLGASTEARVHPAGSTPPVSVDVPHADDDVAFADYHPERNGGPLHLVGVCVNETIDRVSGRQLQKDKGLPMCVGPAGVSVGLRYHGVWDAETAAAEVPLRPLSVVPDPDRFHVFARRDRKATLIEHLRLGQWMAISGAAFTTGAGRYTSLAQSLLLGLLNIRLGYWWDSGIEAGNRPGRYPPNLWRRLKSLPATVFRIQATLLNEWRGYFPGPAERLWYLSDGGHFDNTGLYELIRRRVPLIIAIDGAQDYRYEFEDLAILTRQVRLDFDADLRWLDPTGARQAGKKDWKALESKPAVPVWIQDFFDPDAIGTLADLKSATGRCAALACISYGGYSTKTSWLLLVKASLAPDIPIDVRNYAMAHPAFPNQPTLDQFFDDVQWESYRKLGECAGMTVFR